MSRKPQSECAGSSERWPADGGTAKGGARQSVRERGCIPASPISAGTFRTSCPGGSSIASLTSRWRTSISSAWPAGCSPSRYTTPRGRNSSSMSDTRLKAPVSKSAWSIHDGRPRPARNAARSHPRRSLRGSTAATADAFSTEMSPRLVSCCIRPDCGREPAFRRKACGMPRSLPEKPSALADGAFTDPPFAPLTWQLALGPMEYPSAGRAFETDEQSLQDGDDFHSQSRVPQKAQTPLSLRMQQRTEPALLPCPRRWPLCAADTYTQGHRV